MPTVWLTESYSINGISISEGFMFLDIITVFSIHFISIIYSIIILHIVLCCECDEPTMYN